MVTCPYCGHQIKEDDYYDWEEEFYGSSLLIIYNFDCDECSETFFLKEYYNVELKESTIIKGGLGF